MTKSKKSPATLTLSAVPGAWYFRWVYQMRDTSQTKLKAKTEEEAVREGIATMKKYPDLDQPHVIFISTDGYTTRTVPMVNKPS